MSILNKLLKNTNTSAENKLQERVDNVQSAFEESESEKEASIRAVNAAIEEIKNNPQMPIGEFLSKLQKNTDLKDSDIVKIIKQLPDLKSEEAVLSAVESTDLSSKEISGIIKNTDISTDTAQKIVEQIPDEDIKKEQKSQIEKMVEEEQTRRTKAKEDSILSQLSKIYNSCDSLEDTAIVELISQLNIENRTKNISDKIMDIVAKRTALDCMKYGTPRLPTLTKLVSSLDMFETNLPFLAQKEYKTISKEYDSKGKNYRQFDDTEKELIRNISHDLKTPLTAIKGYVEGLHDGIADTPEKQAKYIKTISNKVNDMDKLIDELTIYSRLDANRILYTFIKLNVSDYFDDCCEEIGTELDASGIELNYRNHIDKPVMIVADPEQLKRVINNIISNSVKYMVEGRKGKIDIDLYDEGEYVHVVMADNGKGIADKDISRIFERFYRTDESRNSKQGGSGIGLAIVKKIVEDHKGKIWAESVEGEGTTMHLNLLKYNENNQLGILQK